MTRGWCPFSVRRDTANFGYPQGTHGQNRPLFFVKHIMAGYKSTLDGPWRESARVGVHFGVGRDGSKSQYTNIFDAHWGNGVSGSIEGYDRSNRHLANLESIGTWGSVMGGGHFLYQIINGRVLNLPNTHSISIEHEGFSYNIWTPEMTQASTDIQEWCLAETARYGMGMLVDDRIEVGHYQIDSVNRANCPGPNWPREKMLAALQEDDMGMTQQEAEAFSALAKRVGKMEKRPTARPIQKKGGGAVEILMGSFRVHIDNSTVLKRMRELGWLTGPLKVLPADDPIWKLPRIEVRDAKALKTLSFGGNPTLVYTNAMAVRAVWEALAE